MGLQYVCTRVCLPDGLSHVSQFVENSMLIKIWPVVTCRNCSSIWANSDSPRKNPHGDSKASRGGRHTPRNQNSKSFWSRETAALTGSQSFHAVLTRHIIDSLERSALSTFVCLANKIAKQVAFVSQQKAITSGVNLKLWSHIPHSWWMTQLVPEISADCLGTHCILHALPQRFR